MALPPLYSFNEAIRAGAIKRFEVYTRRGELDACWRWVGPIDKDGYGLLRVAGGKMRAHRLAFELHHGAIDADLLVLHSCDNPRCVNPGHLSQGTPLRNVQDRNERNRQAKGMRNGRALITAAAADFIKSSTMTAAELAEIFGVAKGAIWDIKTGRNWKDVQAASVQSSKRRTSEEARSC